MNAGHDKRRVARQVLVAAIWLATLATTAFVVFALTWPDDLTRDAGALFLIDVAAFFAATFAFHAGLGALALGMLAGALRRWALVLVALAVGLAGAGPEVRLAASDRVAPRFADDAVVLYSANLMYGRADPAALLADIQEHDPDLLLFQEWTPQAHRSLTASLRERYPHAHEHPREDAFGQAVFSKWPTTEPAMHYPVEAPEPQITIAVEPHHGSGGHALRVTNVHLLPPVGRRYINGQRSAAAAIASWAEVDTAPPDVLIGDFNAVARSSIMRHLHAAGYSDAHQDAGSGRGVTWPERGPMPIRAAPGLRIDHALTGPRWRAVRSEIGRDIASDHRPIIVTIEPTRTASRERE